MLCDPKTPYEEKCECGQIITVLAQPDRHPEYSTEIGVICQKCGDTIYFTLPVN